jgi:hypothetical protein
MDSNAYRLSRIYGEGWKAAKRSRSELDDLQTRPESENPHEALEERARWSKGFEDGLRSNAGARGASSPISWRHRTVGAVKAAARHQTTKRR